MSDRTKVTEGSWTGPGPGEAEPGASQEGAPTRADRIMGRRSSTDGPGSEDAGGSGTTPGSAQRPTSVPGRRGIADPSSDGPRSDRPSDGWGFASTSSGAGGRDGEEDETPTRVTPKVPTFRTPRREAGAGAGGGSTGHGGSSGRGGSGATAGGPSTTETTTMPAVGAGSLGTVTESMQRPAPTEAPVDPMPARERPRASRAASRKPRRARLRLSRIDPWSVMKTSFLFSIALGIAAWVAVAFVWWVIQQSGLFVAVNQTVSNVLQTPGDADPFRLEAYINGPRLLGATAVLAVFNVIVITCLITVVSFLYNLSATMLGGLQVTLAETDD